MNAEKQRKLSEFVSREVIYCVSTMVSDILPRDFEDIEYESDASRLAGGYEPCNECDGEGWDDHTEEKCSECDGDGEILIEIFEHWIVSNWLADKLETFGERVVRDYHGLTVWGRQTTGQAIAMDYVIERIYDSIHGGDDES